MATNKKKKKASAKPRVRVRMYRQGLGDCFLITFDHEGANPMHVLIDCGTLGATTTGVKMKGVVKSIREATGDHLHLLIATHEHLDHLSGFGNYEEEFDHMQVDRVWVAWTEDPEDKMAKGLARTKRDIGKALTQAALHLEAAPAASPARELGLAIGDLVGFFGMDGPGVDFGPSVHKAMEYVRNRKGAKRTYLVPGEDPFGKEGAWLPGFRFYVLGPPRDRDALNDTGEHGSSELYGLLAALQTATAFHLSRASFTTYAASDDARKDRTQFEQQMPFDPRFRMERSSTAVRSHYGATYFSPREAWRTVDHDWLQIVSDLALQLDSTTNNTSVALAIERIADGKVLLFPADAQQGNWLSWHRESLKWRVPGPNGGSKTVTIRDLLRRTVLYKVGHHASHNATARAKGLELMEKPDELIAFIPVDRAVALGRHPKNSWKMPARPLYRRLLEKCNGRVLRSDLGWAADSKGAASRKTEKEFDGLATAAEWKKWKKAQDAADVTIDPMYVEVVIE